MSPPKRKLLETAAALLKLIAALATIEDNSQPASGKDAAAASGMHWPA